MPASAAGPARSVPVPVTPEAVKHNHAAGATAAAAHFWGTAYSLQITADSTPLDDPSTDSCQYCDAIAAPLIDV